MLRIPHCLNSLLINGSDVSVTQRSPSTHEEHCFRYAICQRLSEPQGLVMLEGLDKLIKIIHHIGSRTLDLPTCTVQTVISVVKE
jgi:hypothetical protein